MSVGKWAGGRLANGMEGGLKNCSLINEKLKRIGQWEVGGAAGYDSILITSRLRWVGMKGDEGIEVK